MLVQFEDFLQFFGREVLIEGNVLTFAVLEDTVGDGTAAGASVQLGVCPDFVSQIFRQFGYVVADTRKSGSLKCSCCSSKVLAGSLDIRIVVPCGSEWMFMNEIG